MVKRILILTVSIGYYWLRSGFQLVIRRFGGKARPGFPVVLTYHSVRSEEVVRFEKQMLQLKRLAKPVFPDEPVRSDHREAVAVTFDDGFQSVFERALPVMMTLGIPATVFIPTGFLGRERGWGSDEEIPSYEPETVVSAEILALWAHRGVKVASHTVTHPRLAGLDREVLRWELQTSKRTLETIAGRSIDMLAFPYGSFNPDVIAAADQAGYGRVFANVPVPRSRQNSSILVGRVNVSPQDWPIEFRLKVQGAYNWMAWAIRAKRSILSCLGRRSLL